MSRQTMKGQALVASLLLSGGIVGSACSIHDTGEVVYVPSAPPPAVREVVTVSPGTGYIWIPGHHAWQGGAYVWIGGRWDRPSGHHAHWVSGQWRHDRRGWYWVDGHWR
jgi:YXWGXW repeat-containing protein